MINAIADYWTVDTKRVRQPRCENDGGNLACPTNATGPGTLLSFTHN